MRDPVASFLLKRFAPDQDDRSQRRSQIALLEGYLSVVVNTVLFAIKLAVGLLTGSIALIADAAHTLADSLTSGVVIASTYIARRPADEKHPFGHGRAELIGALIIAVLLGVTALEFGKSSVDRLLHPQALDAPWWAAALITATALGKHWMARFADQLGVLADSRAIEADAWHHKTDVYATLLVVVAMIGSRFGLLWIDGVMGLAVSLLIAWTAYQVALESINPLLGQAPTAQDLHEIVQRAREFEQVLGVHDIVVHQYGETRIVSLHIETSEELGVQSAHNLAEHVQDRVGQGYRGMVVAHVDPISNQHPHFAKIQELFAGFIGGDERLASFHDLRIVGDNDEFSVLVDLSSHGPIKKDDEQVLHQALLTLLREHFPKVKLVTDFEPLFAYPEKADPHLLA